MVSSLPNQLCYDTELRSRLDVTSAITTLIIDGIASHSMLLDSYVVLHAAFIASLHKIIGVEFGQSVHHSRIKPHTDLVI